MVNLGVVNEQLLGDPPFKKSPPQRRFQCQIAFFKEKLRVDNQTTGIIENSNQVGPFSFCRLAAGKDLCKHPTASNHWQSGSAQFRVQPVHLLSV